MPSYQSLKPLLSRTASAWWEGRTAAHLALLWVTEFLCCPRKFWLLNGPVKAEGLPRPTPHISSPCCVFFFVSLISYDEMLAEERKEWLAQKYKMWLQVYFPQPYLCNFLCNWSCSRLRIFYHTKGRMAFFSASLCLDPTNDVLLMFLWS